MSDKPNELSPTVGSWIPGKDAKALCDNWTKASVETKMKATIDRNYEFSGCDCYAEMAKVPGCVGFKMYDGLDKENVHHFVRYPVDKAGNILSRSTGKETTMEEEPDGVNITFECPPICIPPTVS